MAIWLQYDDPDKDNNGGEFMKHVYPDEEYEDALIHYEIVKTSWPRTRMLFENDNRTTDWVILQDDSYR